MTEKVLEKKISELSDQELEQLLQKRKEEKQKEEERKRKAYEDRKNALVNGLIEEAWNTHRILKRFKTITFKQLEDFYTQLMAYGGLHKENKGNFTIKDASGNRKVEFSRNVTYGFDERANIADKKLKEFLAQTVKKKDQSTYELILSLLEKKASTQDYDPRNIQKLFKHENKFTDPLWLEAIKLFKEAYIEQNSTYYVRFYEADANGKPVPVQLQFSAIEVEMEGEQKAT